MTRSMILAVSLVLAAPAALQGQYAFGSTHSGYPVRLVLDGVEYTSADQGWYNDVPNHVTTNQNYITGDLSVWYRSFFAFDIPVAAPFTQALLRINSGGVSGSPQIEFFDFVGDVNSLLAGTGGAAAYNDLGNGAVYGSRVYTVGDAWTVHDIALNGAALSAINGQRGDRFVMGGSMVGSGDMQVPGAVPEPATVVLLGTGLVGLFGLQRRRRAA